eukprot:2712905-Rhodomonas_salina.1
MSHKRSYYFPEALPLRQVVPWQDRSHQVADAANLFVAQAGTAFTCTVRWPSGSDAARAAAAEHTHWHPATVPGPGHWQPVSEPGDPEPGAEQAVHRDTELVRRTLQPAAVEPLNR